MQFKCHFLPGIFIFFPLKYADLKGAVAMSTILSIRAQQFEPSATMAVNARAQALKNQGREVINLSVGEPDFDTPDFIKEAGIRAINEGFTKYTNVDGHLPLKKAIVNKLKRDNHLDYKPEQIIVTSGAKQAIYNAALATLNQGDEAIVPAPYWVSYPAIITMAEAKSVIIEAGLDQHFKITPAQLEQAITPKTRWLVINSPSNPSGMAYTDSELRALADVLLKHPQILILSDDIYEYILWSNHKFANILNVCPELFDRTIVVNGMSKAYSMTGWRLGYAAGPAEIIGAMNKIQSQSTTCASSITQAASMAALAAEPHLLDYMKDAFKARHDLLYHGLTEMKGIECIPADGTFYLFPKVTGAMKHLGLNSDIEFATYLLDKANVAVVPGTAFGLPGYVRFSYATSEALLQKAVNQIKAALN
jgi:aspartate aminotransferase